MNKISATIAGASGISGLELLQIMPANPGDMSEVLKIVTQLLIGIVTLWHLVKKPKK